MTGLFEPSRQRLDGLAEWFEAEYEPLRRFGYVLTGDWYVAEDLVQETFVRLYRARGRIDPEGLPAYARKTMVHARRTWFRRSVREQDLHHRERRPHSSDPADTSDRDEIWNAILTLSRQQRAIVALRFYEDMTDADIARTLGVGMGSVKKQMSRAMTRLRTALGERRKP